MSNPLMRPLLPKLSRRLTLTPSLRTPLFTHRFTVEDAARRQPASMNHVPTTNLLTHLHHPNLPASSIVSTDDSIPSVAPHLSTSHKPTIPYTKHAILTARPHAPGILPTDHVVEANSHEFCRQLAGDTNERAIDVCLAHPPSLGKTTFGELRFRISQRIKVGMNIDAQIARVEILHTESTNVSTGMQVAAKFVDPLYWDWFDHAGTDPFQTTDAQHAHEVHVYEALKERWGTSVPHFYGSYSVAVPVGHAGEYREVRMLLMEYVHGHSLAEAQHLPKSATKRQAIMKAVLEADKEHNLLEVCHDDFAPRNVMLVSCTEEKAEVRWIDWAMGSVKPRAMKGLVERLKRDEKKTMREQWADKGDLEGAGFGPLLEGWDYHKWLEREYR